MTWQKEQFDMAKGNEQYSETQGIASNHTKQRWQKSQL